ncbi:MAG: YggT family protein [Candidatus Gastranaerophilales bacterium]|nr:YggT family protein [Candidatus Gastranaerophilales bacterium]
MGIANAVSKIFYLIYLTLLITILLSWFPNIKWHNEPFRSLRAFSEIFLAPFRKLIPPIGMIDISPIVAFVCLSIVAELIVKFLYAIGL